MGLEGTDTHCSQLEKAAEKYSQSEYITQNVNRHISMSKTHSSHSVSLMPRVYFGISLP